jgi:hypothetical protein
MWSRRRGAAHLVGVLGRSIGDARRGETLQGMHEPFPLHAGVVAEASAALSYGVWDFLVHGFDIANACEREWPMPPVHAARALRAGLPAIRPWVEPEVLDGPRQRVVVAFASGGEALALEVGEGRYGAELADPGAADASVDPVEALLAISRRVPARHPLVARLAGWYQPI